MSFFTFLTETDDQYKDLDPVTQLLCDKGPLDADHLFDNTTTNDISELYISLAYTGPVDVNISIDRGVTTPWNQIMVINHTFPAGSTFTIKSGTTSGVTDHTDTMTFRQFDVFFRTASTRTDRYIKITLHDPQTTSHSISIGRIMVGLATTLATNFNYEWEELRAVMNNTNISEVRSRTVNRITEWIELTFTFEEMTESQMRVLTGFTDSLHGDAVYFFLIPDPAVNDGYLMRLVSEVRVVHGKRKRLNPLTFAEESRGERVVA